MNSVPIFIAWSGPKSKAIGELVSKFLPNVVKGIKPFVSFLDIEAGTNWQDKLHDTLSMSRLGLLFITSENIGNPWIHFEAGVLSGKGRRVIPYFADIELGQGPRGPLERLQAKRLDRDSAWELTQIVANIAANPNRNAADDLRAVEEQEYRRTDDKVRKKFEHHWPILESKLAAYTATTKPPSIAKIQTLKNRNAMYAAAKGLIDSSKSFVFDTTWGRPTDQSGKSTSKRTTKAQKPNPARDAYLAAKDTSIRSTCDGSYHELILDCPGHRKRIASGAKIASESASYHMTVVDGELAAFPLPDFMVVDDEKILLAGYHEDGSPLTNQFLLVESPEFARFLMAWFNECIRDAKKESRRERPQRSPRETNRKR